ncbi:MAG: V-type ATP synthase subunit D [Candidatus Lokiarchaeota archaeon]|nr:V-type ATP synthase subunit D [Candidatus Lokiarchaeota archaeon]
MSFRETKPTKTNLINLKKKLQFALRGKNFLEFKRELLILQIKNNFENYKNLRKEFFSLFRETMLKLNQTYKEMGKNNLSLISQISTIQYKPRVSIGIIKEFGISLSKINYELIKEEKLPAYSFDTTSQYLDELIELLKKFFELIIFLAEKEDLMLNFAFDFKKIDRRINGLENIIIPELQTDVKKIKKILEELERESFVRLKKTKYLINKKKIKIGVD